MSGFADAVSREAAWLRDTTAAGLPPLLVADGGPFTSIEDWMLDDDAVTQPRLEVALDGSDELLDDSDHVVAEHHILVRVLWPRSLDLPADLQAMADAIVLVLQRIRAAAHDKTHGGRFLTTVANTQQESVQVAYVQIPTFAPGVPMPQGRPPLEAHIRYVASDQLAG